MSYRGPDLDDLLSGGDAGEHEALAAVLRAAAEVLPTAPSPGVAERHLMAITSEATTHAHTAPAVTPPSRVAVWRRRVAHLLGATAVKVGLGVGIAAGATGGLAATGSLPEPAQRVASEVAERVGIVLPRADDASGPDAATTPPEPAFTARPERGGEPQLGDGGVPSPAGDGDPRSAPSAPAQADDRPGPHPEDDARPEAPDGHDPDGHDHDRAGEAPRGDDRATTPPPDRGLGQAGDPVDGRQGAADDTDPEKGPGGDATGPGGQDAGDPGGAGVEAAGS